MQEQINKQKVKKLLTSLETIDARKENVLNEDGETLNIKKFNDIPLVFEVVKQLKEMGINKSYLMDNGFMYAGFVLIL